MSLTKVKCIIWCLGPWDYRWPGVARKIEEGEIFFTETEPEDLPPYLEVYDGDDGEENATIEPMDPAHSSLGEAVGDSIVVNAVSELDPDNDDHWTDQGLPSVRAVNEIIGGKVKVSRTTNHNVIPLFSRPS